MSAMKRSTFSLSILLAGSVLHPLTGQAELELSPKDLTANERTRAKPTTPSIAVERREEAPPKVVAVPTNTTIQVRLELIDGSVLLGLPLVTELPVQTSFATMKIPVAAIESVEFIKNTENCKLKLKNGDAMQGVIKLPSLRLDTCIGKVEIRQEHIARLRVKLAGGVEELHFRAYVDGLDEIHIRGDSLWYVHRSWKKPGQSDEAQEQTFINGKAWTPTWKGNVSDKFRPVEPALPDRGNYRVNIEKTKARGELRVTQEPNEDNGFEAVILVDDSNVPSQDWYEFTLRWSP